MARYNKKIVADICKLIETDSYTIAEICQLVNIHKDTYYDWLKNKPDFSDAIKGAQGIFDELMVSEAKKSLVKLVRGYTAQEKKTITQDTGRKDENNKPIVKVKEYSVTDKHYQPNTAAVIFTLCNRDPDNWKNKHENTLAGEVGIKSNLENLSDDELQKIVDGDVK